MQIPIQTYPHSLPSLPHPVSSIAPDASAYLLLNEARRNVDQLDSLKEDVLRGSVGESQLFGLSIKLTGFRLLPFASFPRCTASSPINPSPSSPTAIQAKLNCLTVENKKPGRKTFGTFNIISFASPITRRLSRGIQSGTPSTVKRGRP